eukprot:14977509-Alexandrium_andersonii.AAC.1
MSGPLSRGPSRPRRRRASLLGPGLARGYEVRATQAQERWDIFLDELEARPWPGQHSLRGQPPLAGTHRVVECRACG